MDRLVVDSGGEIYPDNPVAGPIANGAHEYGGGGPEYIEAVGLASGAVDMLKPLAIENLERSFFSDLTFSKSR